MDPVVQIVHANLQTLDPVTLTEGREYHWAQVSRPLCPAHTRLRMQPGNLDIIAI